MGNKKSIIIRTKRFPQVSETFVLYNIIYALENGFSVYIDSEYWIPKNAVPHQDLLNNIYQKAVVLEPIQFKGNYLEKLLQVFSILKSPRILRFVLGNLNLLKQEGLMLLTYLKKYDKLARVKLFHIHFCDALGLLPELFERGFLKGKCIITFHGIDAFGSGIDHMKCNKFFYSNCIQAFTCNSLYLRDQLLIKGIPASMIQVIPVGIDFYFFKGTRRSIPTKSPVELLSVGRLIPLKGHKYAIEVIKELKNRGLNVKFTLVGSGQLMADLKEQTDNYDLSDVITFVGFLGREALKDIYKNSHLFLFTSTVEELTNREESFGLVSLEAQASGIPVIAFNTGGVSETLSDRETGFLVGDRAIKGMADHVERLVSNPEHYERISEAGIRFSEKFDYSSTANEYIRLYNEVLL